MAQYKITALLPSSFCRILVTACWLILAGCASIQAAAAPGDAPAFAIQRAGSRTEEPLAGSPPEQVTFTPLVLPSVTLAPTATATPTLTNTPTETQTPTATPTAMPTATPTPAVIPALSELSYISLSRLDMLDRLAVLSPDGAAGTLYNSLAFSPNGRWLALADGPSIHLWDLSTGQPAPPLFADGALFSSPLFGGTVAIHPNARQLAAVDEHGQVWSWMLPADSSEPIPGPGFAPANVEQLTQIAYTVDGSRLAGLGVRDGQSMLLLWETTTGNILLEKPTGSISPGSLLVSPNGAWIIQAVGEGILRFWAPTTGKSLGQQIIYACPDSLLGAAFSRDGAILALQCDGETDRIFLDAPNYYSPGDRWLAGTLEDSAPGPGLLSFNRDGGLLAAAAGRPARQLQLWNLIDKYPARALADFGSDIRQVTFSPDGKWLAVCLDDGSVELWGVVKPG